MTAPGDGDRGLLVVGASLAGLSAVRQLSRSGHSAAVRVVGEEPHLPYDRPPMSKGVLAGRLPPASTQLVQDDVADDVEWRLGTPIVGLDRSARRVRLADGTELAYERLLVATGRRARPWPVQEEAALDGVLSVRTIEDAADLRARLERGLRRVIVIGAGFLGSEVASVCRDLGIAVSVVDLAHAPLQSALGATVGSAFAFLQRERGVDLRLGRHVRSLDDEGTGAVRRVVLDDGSRLDCDVVVVAIGSVANTEWLQGCGLAVDGRGLVCDATLRAIDGQGEPQEDVWVAGDVARWPHPAYADQLLAVEHWGTADEQGAHAARNLVAAPGDRRPFTELPRFWSNQFGVNAKSVGVPSAADRVVVTQGSVDNRRCVLLYGSGDRTVAAASIDAPRELEFHVGLVATAAPFPPQLNVPDWVDGNVPEPVPARFPAPAGASHQAPARVTEPLPSDPIAALGLQPRAPEPRNSHENGGDDR